MKQPKTVVKPNWLGPTYRPAYTFTCANIYIYIVAALAEVKAGLLHASIASGTFLIIATQKNGRLNLPQCIAGGSLSHLDT